MLYYVTGNRLAPFLWIFPSFKFHQNYKILPDLNLPIIIIFYLEIFNFFHKDIFQILEISDQILEKSCKFYLV